MSHTSEGLRHGSSTCTRLSRRAVWVSCGLSSPPPSPSSSPFLSSSWFHSGCHSSSSSHQMSWKIWMAKKLGPLLRTNLISTNKELAVKRMDALGEKCYGIKGLLSTHEMIHPRNNVMYIEGLRYFSEKEQLHAI